MAVKRKTPRPRKRRFHSNKYTLKGITGDKQAANFETSETNPPQKIQKQSIATESHCDLNASCTNRWRVIDMNVLNDVVKTALCCKMCKGKTLSILEKTEEKTNQSSFWQFQCSACNDKQQFYTSGKHKIFYS